MNTKATALLFLLCAPVTAQDSALQRAILIEEREHDLEQAVRLYRSIAQDRAQGAEVRTRAWLRLGRGLRRLGKREEGRAALERAAAGEGAAAASAGVLLADQGQNIERLKELRARARAVLESGERKAADQLRWIGPAAVAEIVREIEQRWQKAAAQARDRAAGKVPERGAAKGARRPTTPGPARAGARGPGRSRQKRPLSTGDLVSLTWELGGEEARVFLQRVLDRGDAEQKDTACSLPANLHPSLLPIADRFLDDPDLEGYSVVHVAEQLASHRPLKRFLRLAQSPDPEIAAEIWELLNRRWRAQSRADKEGTMAAFVPALRLALESKASNLSRAARQFLFLVGLETNVGRKLLLDLAPSWPRTKPVMDARGIYKSIGRSVPRPANLADVVRAARRLGPCDLADSRCHWLRNVVTYLSPSWSRDGLPEVVELINQGYFFNMGAGEVATRGETLTYYHWLIEHAVESDIPTVLEALKRTPWVFGVVEWLADMEARLPEAAWPILHERWKGLGNEERGSGAAGWLYLCMGRAGALAATPFFLETGLQSPRLYPGCGRGLVELAKISPRPRVRDAMRALVLHRFQTEGGESSDAVSRKVIQVRGELFGALMKMGDAEFAKRLPEFGPDRRGPKLSAVASLPTDGKIEVWSHLLDQGDDYWWQAGDTCRGQPKDAGGTERLYPGRLMDRGPRVSYGTYFPRMTILPLFVERVHRAMLQDRGSTEPLARGRLRLLSRVLDLPGKVPGVDEKSAPPVARRIEDLTSLCLQSKRPRVRAWTLFVLQDRQPTDEQRPHVVGLLGDESPEIRKLALEVVARHVTLAMSDLAAVLQSPDEEWRSEAAPRLIPRCGEPAVAAVLPLLRDGAAAVREAACTHLGRWTDAKAVAPLLATLRDPAPAVRTAAERALRSIRFYHEQRVHWDRAFDGIRVDGNSVAEALVRQADPKNDKKTRLLAIRSLGLLGVVETLPFLIGYTLETDAEIRSAAQRAVEMAQERAAKSR